MQSNKQTTEDLMDKYRRHPFADGLLPFNGAIRGLDAPFPRIYAMKDGNQRWVIYDKKTRMPALFSHAALVAGCDDPDTGNYVPEGQSVPMGVELKTVQRRANTKCFYTYIFDTFVDVSLYEGQWRLDEYMRTLDEFKELPRRAYLSRLEVKYRSRFWMQTPMFLRRGPAEGRVPPPTHLHPLVVKADTESKIFRANPDRPRLWVKTGTGITPMSEGSPRAPQRGDVVALSFTVTYHLTSVHWFAQFHPADIVVLRTGDGDGPDYSAPTLDLHDRPPPSFDASLVRDDEPDVYEYTAEDKNHDAGGVSAVDMDGMLRDDTEATDSGGEAVLMEVDDGVGTDGEDDDLPELVDMPAGEAADGYDLIGDEADDHIHTVEDFVDVMADEVEDTRRSARSTTRGARLGRKRN